jgi:chromosome segregation protein
MWTITYFSGILGAIVFMFLGWLISKLIQGNNKEDWESKHQEAVQAVYSLQKKVKNEKLQVEQNKTKAEDYKNRLDLIKKESLDKDAQYNKMKLHVEEVEHNAEKEKKRLDNEIQRLSRINEKLDKDLTQQRQKYKTDMEDMKNWKSEKEQVGREINDLKSKLNRYKESATDYKSKYEQQQAEIDGIRDIKREIRASKAKISKLEADVKYWEKKHYDAHHELAELKKKTDSYKSEFEKMEQLRKGDEVLKSNLVQQITEFKTKYLDISSKYRSLTNRSN